MYWKQTADVRWEGMYSDEFSLKNGVKQGAVLSPILFCYYMNDLFNILRKNKVGCQMGSEFSGCFGYADNLLLMVTLNEKYAKDHNITFSTDPSPKKSKTKGIVFTNKLVLCNNE